MYRVRAVHRSEGWSEIWKDVPGAAKAYELAHELQAALWGLNNDDKLNEKWQGKNFYVTITNKNGKSAWQECARARCPASGVQ